MKLYVIYDKVAEKSGPIFHGDNDAVAIRGYNRLVNNGEIEPEDYQLVCVGEYDDRTMDIQTCLPHVVEVALVSQLPDAVKVDLGRTCKNCVSMTSGSGGFACDNGNSIISPDTETCDDWRCK